MMPQTTEHGVEWQGGRVATEWFGLPIEAEEGRIDAYAVVTRLATHEFRWQLWRRTARSHVVVRVEVDSLSLPEACDKAARTLRECLEDPFFMLCVGL